MGIDRKKEKRKKKRMKFPCPPHSANISIFPFPFRPSHTFSFELCCVRLPNVFMELNNAKSRISSVTIGIQSVSLHTAAYVSRHLKSKSISPYIKHTNFGWRIVGL